MISEERFKQLADKQATVYWVYKDFIDVVTANLSDVDWFGYERVFETEEEATEYLKYGNVTRTEKFPYVSWEEFCNGKSIKFTTKDNYSFTCEVVIYSDLGKAIIIYRPLIACEIFKEPLTRENYRKALDICVKLFKGEEL